MRVRRHIEPVVTFANIPRDSSVWITLPPQQRMLVFRKFDMHPSILQPELLTRDDAKFVRCHRFLPLHERLERHRHEYTGRIELFR
jgi:hypothetical protein